MVAAHAADTAGCPFLPAWNVSIHKTFEQLSVVRDTEMEKFMDNDHLLKGSIFPEKVFTQADSP